MKLLKEMSAAEYHADPWDTPSLSASTAHRLTLDSPKHAWLYHPKLGNKRFEPTESMDEGTVCHKLVLGKGGEFEILQFDDYRKNAAKEARDAARAMGKLPLLEKHAERLHAIAFRIMAEMKREGILLAGEREAVAMWEETADNGNKVRCRAMMDHYLDGQIADLKFVDDANPRKYRTKFEEYGYHIQSVSYESAIETLAPQWMGRAKMTYLFCEMREPYCVVPADVAGTMHELGHMLWRRAINTWEECLRTGHWPGFKRARVEASSWKLEEEQAYAV